MGGDGRIVVLGEALVDLVVARNGSLDARPGGAPFNAARAAARLGAPVAFGGAVSDDRFGRDIRSALESDGVSTELVQGVTVPTTLAVAELDEGGSASYRFYIEATSAPAFECPPIPASVPIVMTGGLALVIEPMASSIEASLAAMPVEPLLLVDVNCRPGVIGNRASYVERVGRVLARTDVVKISDDDLAYLEPNMPTLDAAAALLDSAAHVVLVTAGASGTTILTTAGRSHLPAASVEVVDTIGAGDAFGGAFAAWWHGAGLTREALGDMSLVERAVAAANHVAAITCTRRGADPPLRADLGTAWTP